MDERDKDLTHLFVRDLDEIPLPPRGEWRRAQGREHIMTRTSRYVLTAGAVVAVLAIALIVGVQLNERQQSAANPSASPTATASASASPVTPPGFGPTAIPTASSAPSPASGAILNDDFGFIVIRSGFAAIRKESTPEFSGPSFDAQTFAVSPDGKQVAYFRRGPGANGEGAELRTFSVGSSTEQTLVTLAADTRGGGVVWSSDGSGLLYSTESGAFGIGGATNKATLNIYELAANGRHGTILDQQNNTGWLYRPLAWDRAANIAAAGGTGEGGYMGFYLTAGTAAGAAPDPKRTDTSSALMVMGSVHASSDAKFVLGVESAARNLRWWPLADYAAAKSQAGAGKGGALWRPGTHEIGFMGPSDQFWLGDVEKANQLGLCCTAFSGAPAGSTVRAFRADGSAVILAVQFVPPGSPPPVSQTQYTLVRIGSDPKATSGDRVTLQDVNELLGSVRLR